MKKDHFIVVLDYTDGNTYIYPGRNLEWETEEIEAFISEKGHNLSSCEWMSSLDLIDERND